MAEYIYEIKNNLHLDVCKHIIEKFEQDKDKCPGRIVSGNIPGGIINPIIKDSTDLPINPSSKKWEDVDKYLSERLKDGIDKYIDYLKKLWTDHDHSFENSQYSSTILFFQKDTGYQIQRITKGGHYVYHSDYAANYKRMVTFIWYLNDLNTEDGGTTEFLTQKVKIKPEAGKIIFFPATWTYVHKGSEVLTDNTKYIITGFLVYD